MAAAWSGRDLSAQAEEDQAWAEAQAEEDQAWAEAWEEMEEELESEQEAAPAFILLLPEEILHRVLGFLSHSTLVNTVFRVNVRLSRASAAEARTRTQTRLLDALIAGFGGAAEATRPRLSSLATQLETALASAGSARYQSKFRQLIFNLKDPKNPDLRARLLSGDIGTADLLRLTAQQVVHTTSPPRIPPHRTRPTARPPLTRVCASAAGRQRAAAAALGVATQGQAARHATTRVQRRLRDGPVPLRQLRRQVHEGASLDPCRKDTRRSRHDVGHLHQLPAPLGGVEPTVERRGVATVCQMCVSLPGPRRTCV